MAKCCICDKEVTPGVDCESRFTGRTKYICFNCIKNGDEELQKGRIEYFADSYEGRRRLEMGRRKRRQK